MMTYMKPAKDIVRVPSMSGTETTDENTNATAADDDQIEILGELVGATNLVVEDDADVVDPNPYCVVHFGDRKVHWTEPAEGLSPIWTLDSDSLFLLRATPDELTQHSLIVSLWTKQRLGPLVTKTFLGRVELPAETLLKRCDGERFEIMVEDELGDDTGIRGNMCLRLRLATPADSKFVGLWNSSVTRNKKELKALLDKEDNSPGTRLATVVTETDETQVAGASFINALSSAFAATSFYDANNRSKKRRVKPHADPKRPKATQYMCPHEMKLESRKHSENWVKAGSGKLGKVHVEVLSCHNLPNVDVGEAMGNVTDSFVSLVFEDAFVQTPVIDDELSPHWMPWTQRAFSFGVLHPTSQLYIGVFDYDLGPLVDHEPLGRIAVNIGAFQTDTQYTLTYDLFKSSNVTDRTPQGQITIRLRVEMIDEKATLLAALKPRPNIHVNVKKKKSFKVVRYTCFGEYDGEDKFDLAVTRSYVSEIFEHKRHLSYTIGDALRSLIFWRGQVKVLSFMIPLHSFMFFVMASTLVERPQMLPSFLILSIPWIMLANGRKRRQHPSPWYRVPTTFQYLDVLLNGRSTMKVKKICANEGWDEAVKYDEAWTEREQADIKKAEKKAAMQQELNNVGDAKIHTEVKLGIPIDLLVRLGRFQGYIGVVCRLMRQAKMVLHWEESILSFWITAVTLAVGALSLLLPWCFILTWTGRIVVYGLLGPHMMIADLYLRANKGDDIKMLMEQFDRKKRAARLRREQALKCKAVKCLRFGEFITQVPSFNLARHHDRPLPVSTAKLLKKLPSVEISSYLPGQQLFGEMLPRLEDGYRSNHTISLQKMARISKLETRLIVIRAAAKLGGAVRQRRLLKLKSHHMDEDAPPESGYELVETAGQSLSELHLPTETEWMTPSIGKEWIPNLEGMNLCVVPYDGTRTATFDEENKDDDDDLDGSAATFDEEQKDDDDLDDSTPTVDEEQKTDDDLDVPQSLDLLLTKDKGVHHADVVCEIPGAIPDIDLGEYQAEEGIEIVAWGRFNPEHKEELKAEMETISKTDPELEEFKAARDEMPDTDDEELTEEREPVSRNDVASLSVLYRSTDSTFVAFYHP